MNFCSFDDQIIHFSSLPANIHVNVKQWLYTKQPSRILEHNIKGVGRLHRTHPLPLWPALWLTQACCVMLKIICAKDHNVSLKPNKQAVEAEHLPWGMSITLLNVLSSPLIRLSIFFERVLSLLLGFFCSSFCHLYYILWRSDWTFQTRAIPQVRATVVATSRPPQTAPLCQILGRALWKPTVLWRPSTSQQLKSRGAFPVCILVLVAVGPRKRKKKPCLFNMLLGIHKSFIIHVYEKTLRKKRQCGKNKINQGLIPTLGFIHCIFMASFVHCCCPMLFVKQTFAIHIFGANTRT